MDEKTVIDEIMKGLQRRESQVKQASGYFVREIYHSQNQKFYDAYANSKHFMDERTRQAFMKNVMKPPLLTQYFCAAQGQSVRVDERDTFPDSWRHEITVRNGRKLLEWSAWGSSAKKKYLRETKGMNAIEDILQIAIDASTHSLVERIADVPIQYVGTEKIGGIETYKIQYRTRKWGRNVTEWIAFEHGFLTVKKESCLDNAVFENTPFTIRRSVRVVDIISEVKPRIWMPIVRRDISYGTFKDEPAVEQWETMTRFSVVSLDVNEEIPQTIFRLPLPPGTRVWNSDFWRKTGLWGRTLGGNKVKFEAQLAKAKRKGEQPDLDSSDMKVFNERVANGWPPSNELKDAPIASLQLK